MKTIKFVQENISVLAKYEMNEAVKSIIENEIAELVIADIKKRTGNDVITVNVYLRDVEKQVFVPSGKAGNSTYHTVVENGKWYVVRKDYYRVEE